MYSAYLCTCNVFFLEPWLSLVGLASVSALIVLMSNDRLLCCFLLCITCLTVGSDYLLVGNTTYNYCKQIVYVGPITMLLYYDYII